MLISEQDVFGILLRRLLWERNRTDVLLSITLLSRQYEECNTLHNARSSTATSVAAAAPTHASISAHAGVLGRATLHEDGRKTTTDRTQGPFRDFLDITRNHQFSPLHHVQKPI